MPSDKKRINLTVSDSVYERLQTFKEKNGISSDATACLQLIVKQLTADENAEAVFRILRTTSVDELKSMSDSGIAALKTAVDKSLQD